MQVSVELTAQTEAARQELAARGVAHREACARDWADRGGWLAEVREETQPRVIASWNEDEDEEATRRLARATSEMQAKAYTTELAADEIRQGLSGLGRSLRRSASFGQ